MLGSSHVMDEAGNEALRAVMIKGYALSDPLVLRDVGILALFALVLSFGAVASIRREVA